MCLIDKAIYRGSCYCSVTIATGRGPFCRNKDDQEVARQVWKRPIFPPSSGRANASSAPMFWFGPVGVGPPFGRRLSTTRFLSASPGYADIIPGWQPRMASQKSLNLSTGCCARFVNWDIKGRSQFTMRAIRAGRRSPRVPQSAGRETNYRNSTWQPIAPPQGEIEPNSLYARQFRSFPHVAGKRGLALSDSARDRFQAKIGNRFIGKQVGLQVGVSIQAAQRYLPFNRGPNEI